MTRGVTGHRGRF
jgi:hypothetical protein